MIRSTRVELNGDLGGTKGKLGWNKTNTRVKRIMISKAMD